MNLLRYIAIHKKTFEEDPLNKLDVLGFVWTTYFNMEEVQSAFPMTLNEFGKLPYCADLELYHESFVPRTSSTLFRRMVASPRYGRCEILHYKRLCDGEKKIQFGALAFRADGKLIVVFEGTDMSYVGWKEDCMMAYSDTIGSYPIAMDFLRKILRDYEGEVILAGHSKGGNIAAYLLATIEDDSRIVKVYSYEGAGFRNPNVFADHPERIKKLEKYIPHSAVVGVIFNNETEVRIVKSRSVSVLQHNALKWVIHDGDFVYMNKLTVSSRFIDKTANEWIQGLNYEERERFVGLLFQTLDQTGTGDFGSLIWYFARELPTLYHAYRSLNAEDRAFFRRVLRALGKQALLTVGEKKHKPLPVPSSGEEK